MRTVKIKLQLFFSENKSLTKEYAQVHGTRTRTALTNYNLEFKGSMNS